MKLCGHSYGNSITTRWRHDIKLGKEKASCPAIYDTITVKVATMMY